MNAHLAWWQGDGGDAYVRRNEPTPQDIARRARSLSRVLVRVRPEPGSILEVGCGPGANLAALARITTADLFAVEPNESARLAAAKLCPAARIFEGHAEAIPAADASFDLVLTAGTLIHVPPERLADAMAEIVRVARCHVLSIEYFAPETEPVVYHGAERIWRDDYGRKYLAQHRLELVDTGFFWKEDAAGFDNVIWWLMRRSHAAERTEGATT